MFRDLLMSLGLLHIEISKDGKRIEYVKGSIEDIEELIAAMEEYASIVNEREDNAGVNDAIEFADWLNKNASRNAVGSWGYFGNMFYTKTSKELYDIFKSESHPQQKEVDEYEDEIPPL